MSQTKMKCPQCGAEMNHHAMKVDYTSEAEDPDQVDSIFGGVLEEVHTCPNCGRIEMRKA